MCGTIRKNSICSCRCRGWCTFYTHFEVLIWSIRALAEGKYPVRRHDKSEWKIGDAYREGLAGQDMPMRCAIVFVKGDWAEYSSTLGLPTWQDALRPCWGCRAFGLGMYLAMGHGVDGLSWGVNGELEYEEACRRCEIIVVLDTAAKRDELARCVRYDKRDGGSKGRALTINMPHFVPPLLEGDRIEPCPALPDIGLLEELAVAATIVVWSVSAETLTRHRCPLLSEPDLGLVPARALTIDTLHANYLGVMNVFCRVTLWTLMLSGAYGTLGTAEENIQAALLVLKSRLLKFYKGYEGHLTDIGSFTKNGRYFI